MPKDKEYISVKADYKVSLVKISDIVHLESEGAVSYTHLDVYKRQLLSSGSV